MQPPEDEVVEITITESSTSSVNAVESLELDEAIKKCIDYCQKRNIEAPVEILRVMQQSIVTGRKLEIENASECLEGKTNYILINRHDVLNSAMEEIEPMLEPRLTLQVAFYGEVATDMGGPRREFFRLCMQEIKTKYFDNGYKEHLADDYVVVGLIMALSILQNGTVPRFLSPDDLQELFMGEDPSKCLKSLRKGFAKVGLYQIGKALPTFVNLLHPSNVSLLSRRKLLHLLTPKFSEDGSNARSDENITYQSFVRYAQAAASGMRGSTTLNHILQFVTGADDEPPLGFGLSPSIVFTEVDNYSPWSFIPSANTCANTLYLPRCVSTRYPLPQELFDIYDMAFANAYFGKV